MFYLWCYRNKLWSSFNASCFSSHSQLVLTFSRLRILWTWMKTLPCPSVYCTTLRMVPLAWALQKPIFRKTSSSVAPIFSVNTVSLRTMKESSPWLRRRGHCVMSMAGKWRKLLSSRLALGWYSAKIMSSGSITQSKVGCSIEFCSDFMTLLVCAAVNHCISCRLFSNCDNIWMYVIWSCHSSEC